MQINKVSSVSFGINFRSDTKKGAALSDIRTDENNDKEFFSKEAAEAIKNNCLIDNHSLDDYTDEFLYEQLDEEEPYDYFADCFYMDYDDELNSLEPELV